jgi:DNA-3-methyladenine glycosylase
MKQINRNFFKKPTLEILDNILGMSLITEIKGIKTGGMIIEAEAYLGADDPGSFAFGGKLTKRSTPLYGKPGNIFVYLNYGLYYLLNIITEEKEKSGAILIRGIKPEIGIKEMMRRRGKNSIKGLTDGPGKLSIALSIDNKLNNFAIYSEDSPLKLFYGKSINQSKIKHTGRIGIRNGAELPYRALIDTEL